METFNIKQVQFFRLLGRINYWINNKWAKKFCENEMLPLYLTALNRWVSYSERYFLKTFSGTWPHHFVTISSTLRLVLQSCAIVTAIFTHCSKKKIFYSCNLSNRRVLIYEIRPISNVVWHVTNVRVVIVRWVILWFFKL